MITKEKIQDYLDNNDKFRDQYSDIRYGGKATLVDGYTFSYVMDERAHDGDDHSTATLIFSVSKEGEETTLWKETGYYDSYNGTDWHRDFEQVKKVNKIITVYRKI